MHGTGSSLNNIKFHILQNGIGKYIQLSNPYSAKKSEGPHTLPGTRGPGGEFPPASPASPTVHLNDVEALGIMDYTSCDLSKNF